MGYKRQLSLQNISFLYEGREDMGVHVIISGQGCRWYENYFPLISLIHRVNRYKGKLTRIDLALDDRVGDLIPLDKIIKDVTQGNATSKCKSNMEITERDFNGNTLGKALTIGKRSSNTYIRFYDKAKEQKLKDKKAVWNRIEIELKGENAQTVQNVIYETNVGPLFQGILKNYLRIMVPNPKDKNKSRWKNRKYWDNLIKIVPTMKLTQKAIPKTINHKKLWVEKQVGQTLAMITMADGGSTDFIDSLITENAKRLKRKNKLMVQEHLQREEELKEEYLDREAEKNGE